MTALPAGARSLWSDDSVNLFSNHKAMHVGDIVTIIIVEDASASNQSQMKLTKESNADLDASGSGSLDFIPLLGGKLDYTKEQQGKGQQTLAGKMNARVTATVIEIRPNGNLVVEGSRQVVINDETDQITVAGVIRPEDIAADNTVLSTYLSEGQISYTGTGALKQAGQQGLIARFLDLLF
jgi:flagellar L-ring protein precursor FlgH